MMRSKLGIYVIVNPLLVTPVELSKVMENASFRVVSHNLCIET